MTVNPMRLRLSSLVLGIALAACAPALEASSPRPVPVTPDREEARRSVGAVLDAFHAAAASADEARYFAHFARGGVFLGTDATERWDVEAFRAYAHPHFAKGKAWVFRAARRTVTLSDSGTVAWFDEDLVTEKMGPARGSGVLVLEDGVFRIAQYNLTITVPNERFDSVRDMLAAPAQPAPSSVTTPP